MRIARIMFAAAVEAKLDYPCMATQDAIDRIRAAAPFHSIQRMLECLRDDREITPCGNHPFVALIFEAWIPVRRKGALGLYENDLVFVTGHDRDWWCDLNNQPENVS